jgi:hypothetical protein
MKFRKLKKIRKRSTRKLRNKGKIGKDKRRKIKRDNRRKSEGNLTISVRILKIRKISNLRRSCVRDRKKRRRIRN